MKTLINAAWHLNTSQARTYIWLIWQLKKFLTPKYENKWGQSCGPVAWTATCNNGIPTWNTGSWLQYSTPAPANVPAQSGRWHLLRRPSWSFRRASSVLAAANIWGMISNWKIEWSLLPLSVVLLWILPFKWINLFTKITHKTAREYCHLHFDKFILLSF